MRRARGWQARKADAGYVGITWPKEVGGRGGSAIEQVIFAQEESRHRLATVPFQVGMGMCIPTMYHVRSPDVAQRYVRPAMRGEEILVPALFRTERRVRSGRGCGPGGARRRRLDRQRPEGLDLLRPPRRLRHSADAHRPPVSPSTGMTMFLSRHDDSPGIEVRPIRTLLGDSEFNEVFLSDVRIPDSQRLGKIGDGWKVALTTLMHERMAIGKPADAPGVDELIALARSIPTETGSKLDDAAVRAAIARFYVNDAGLDFLRMRAQTALSRGQAPGPEASIGKLVMAKTRQDLGAFAMDLLESGAIKETTDPALAAFRYFYLWAPGLRIAGGTDEILRSIIAERVLGLPGDLRADRDVPFNQLS